MARGYLHEPGLTSDRFIPDPFGKVPAAALPDGRPGTQRADGSLECLGRVDLQVKIRGFRVELGEIEAALMRHPGCAMRLLRYERILPAGRALWPMWSVARGSTRFRASCAGGSRIACLIT